MSDSKCQGCGTALVDAGPPINEDYCPNKSCTYDFDRMKEQIRKAMTIPQEYDDLVMRLKNGRSVEISNHDDVIAFVRENHALREEAAAAITALRAERDAAVEALKVDENIIIGACNILDTTRVDLGNQWSEWDQSIRDGLSEILRRAASLASKKEEV